MTLEAMEFIRRFLQHVLPTGFMKVRYYGVLSPTFSVPIEEVKATVEIASGFTVISPEPNTQAPSRHRCPHCGGTLRYLRSLCLPRPAQLRDTAQQTHAMRPAMLSPALNSGP